MAVTPLPPGEAHLPRIVAVISAIALLAWANREAPRILPAVLMLLVLYAALTNLDRAEQLLGQGEAALGRLYHPSTPSKPAPGAGGAHRKP